jgi:hypothetical protein
MMWEVPRSPPSKSSMKQKRTRGNDIDAEASGKRTAMIQYVKVLLARGTPLSTTLGYEPFAIPAFARYYGSGQSLLY